MSEVARALAIGARRLGAARGLAILGGDDAAAARALGDRADLEAPGDPRPRHWRRIDASWLEHALAGEGEAVRAIVLSDRDDPLARWLARWLLGALVAMPPPGPAACVDELPRLEAPVLVRALAAIGRRQLAHAIAGARPDEHAALAARLPWGRALAGEIAAVRSLPDAAAALGARASAARRTADLAWTDDGAPVVAGLRAIAPGARGDVPAQLAQRLPRTLGVMALAELGRFARAPADGVSAAEVARAVVVAS